MSREDNYRDLFRLLAVGLQGTELSEGERFALRQYPPSGIILFERNVEDSDQLRALVREIRGIVIETSGVPPLIMADHEGGRISVLASALGVPPTQMAIAAGRSEKIRKDVYRETAELLKSCGINLILSPLADINSEYLNPVIGTRAFGSDGDKVSELVREAVTTYREEGILTCLKHFPGHGLTDRDSHLTLPAVPITLDKFEDREVVPFVSGIEAGADMVMTAHIRPLDRELPASMDSAVVNGLLRGKLSFEGVIITDALEMKGASLLHGCESARLKLRRLIEQAVSAGNDMLLFSRPVCEIVTEIKRAFDSIDFENVFLSGGFYRIYDKAADRIKKLRNRAVNCTTESYTKISGSGSRDSASGEEKMQDYRERAYISIAADSVRISRDPYGVLPLSADSFPSYRFFGEKGDFSGVPVKLFILRLLGKDEVFLKGLSEKAREGGGLNVNIGNVLKNWPIKDGLSPVEISDGKSAGESPCFYELIFNAGGKNKEEVLFLLCRKPVSRGVVASISVKSDIVVVSDWPYSENLVSEDKTVIITRGIFPAAATAVNGILYGENG